MLMSYFLFPADMHSLLDVTKIADSLVFVLDSTEAWDNYGDYCLSCLFAQGLPSHGNYKSEHETRGFRLHRCSFLLIHIFSDVLSQRWYVRVCPIFL